MCFSMTIFQFPVNVCLLSVMRFFMMYIIFQCHCFSVSTPDTVLVWRAGVWVELQGEFDLHIGTLMRLAPLTEFCHYEAGRVLR